MYRRYLAFFFILLFLLPACDTGYQNRDCACTEVYASEFLYVYTKDGKPIDGMQTRVEDPESGRVYFYYTHPFDYYVPGGYLVMNDKFVKELPFQPIMLEITLRNDSLMIEQMLWFNVDDCRCHIQKTAGPDTLYI